MNISLLNISTSAKRGFWLFVVLLVFVMGSAFAQTSAFRVSFSVEDATCFNNGKIIYSLLDDRGRPVTASYLSRGAL